ncbi:hypothetical protein [Streptacidiphilus cavernicola]|uniref:Uncharacterized protein n=1 Tax=Streptacidiphilus cavernicola TaxID=3342716 RepID=A0ABV6VXQ1_9ACTN
MTETEVLGLRAWLATIDLNLLDPVPPCDRAGQITERIQQPLTCLRCGHPGHSAYVLESLFGLAIDPRWMELCAPCDSWLRRGLDAAAR